MKHDVCLERRQSSQILRVLLVTWLHDAEDVQLQVVVVQTL